MVCGDVFDNAADGLNLVVLQGIVDGISIEEFIVFRCAFLDLILIEDWVLCREMVSEFVTMDTRS